MLQQQIKDDLREAMKAKEATRVSVLRNITAEITNQLLTSGRTPQEELDDKGVLQAIERLAKQRREAMEQYRSGGREDLADQEAAELAVLETYLPEKMSEEQVRKVVQQKKEELGLSDLSGMGQLMSAVMAEVKGQADGALVKEVVHDILSN